MSKSMIKEIYMGNRGFYEKIKLGEEYKKCVTEADDASTKLFNTLTEEQKELYKRLENAVGGVGSETALAYYVEGFKIGLRVGIECMEE